MQCAMTNRTEIQEYLSNFNSDYMDSMESIASTLPIVEARKMCRLLRPEWEEMGIWDELILRISRKFNG